jgi:hypothetical protein
VKRSVPPAQQAAVVSAASSPRKGMSGPV